MNVLKNKYQIKIVMPNYMLTDNSWEVIKKILHKNRVYNKPQNRKILEGILYRLRTGIQWRELPIEYGKWTTVFSRFNAWSKKNIFTLIFKEISKNSDSEWLFIDATVTKANQSSMKASSCKDEAIGKSVAGNSTKIHMAVDSNGLPVFFELSGGHEHDSKYAKSLIKNSPKPDVVTADKGYDSEELREFIEDKGIRQNIPRKSNSKKGNDHMDWFLYKLRHLVENAFQKIKKYRAISTRYDKLARNYNSMIALACMIIWIPMVVD